MPSTVGARSRGGCANGAGAGACRSRAVSARTVTRPWQAARRAPAAPLPLGQAAIWAAVALAFADSSIVVLALPDLLRQLDTSIAGVSLVITVYNVAVVVATPLVVLARPPGRRRASACTAG